MLCYGSRVLLTTAEEEELFRLELIPPPRGVRKSVLVVSGALCVGVGAIWGTIWLGPGVFPTSEQRFVLGALLGGVFAALIVAGLWRRLRPPLRLHPLVLTTRRLMLPSSIYSGRALNLELRAVLYLSVAQGRAGYVEVLTDRRRLRIPLSSVAEPTELGTLSERFKQALKELEGGPEHLSRIEASRQLGDQLTQRHPYVTHALLFGMLTMVIVQGWLGGFSGTEFARAEVSLRLGANAPALIAQEPWRLFSTIFLHTSYFHAYMDGLAIYILGSSLERLIGSARFVAVFLWSAVVGGWLFARVGAAAYDVGASAGIFGILGALAAVHLVAREYIPAEFRQLFRWWVMVSVIAMILPILVPVVDVWGYLGGVLAGMAFGLLFTFAPGHAVGTRAQASARLLAWGGVAVFVVSGGLAAFSAARAPALHEASLQRVLLRDTIDSPLGTLEHAVAIIRHPRAPRHLRQAADVWLSAAAAVEGVHPSILLARSERLEVAGSLPAAIALRWRALQRHGIGALASLVEGLSALRNRPLAIKPARSRALELHRLFGDDTVEVRVTPPIDRNTVVFFIHYGPQGALRGVFEWPLSPSRSSRRRRTEVASLPEVLSKSLDDGGRLEAALWASPALSTEPSYHPIPREAFRRWRRFKPRG